MPYHKQSFPVKKISFRFPLPFPIGRLYRNLILKALAEVYPEQGEESPEILHFVQDDTLCQILRGVYPEPIIEILSPY
jgi:hypothetical protein